MKRYNGFIFLLLVFMLASCITINREPDPPLDSISLRFDKHVGSQFGPDAAIELAKNCFSLNEPIPIHLTLQAGTRDLDIRTSRLFVEGPLESGSSPNLSQIDWEPDGLPPLIKVGEPMIQTTWTITLTIEGRYLLRWEDDQGSITPLPAGFGVGYLVNQHTTRKIPRADLK
ncbi:MAG TPA: hypothetical protein DEF47_15175 [Herpetosiphon sp.]|uniref:hypothetical protein n=1 Tax=Herpetosiphon sp. TaxID=71864 RepID=UPI00059D1147|nr:hypothetical protein [Herpetosiphon sp.]HBW51234.1 hypothetical protein [Herpetosiphon sp.]